MKLISEKLAGRALGFLIAYTALSSVVRAASKLFWCNEVITVALARLPKTLWTKLTAASIANSTASTGGGALEQNSSLKPCVRFQYR
jgi:hypothetical protein